MAFITKRMDILIWAVVRINTVHPLKKIESLSKEASHYPHRSIPFKAAPAKIRVKDRGKGRVTMRIAFAAVAMKERKL